MSKFAILRSAKIVDLKQLREASNHNTRLSKPRNADLSKSHLNMAEYHGNAKNLYDAFHQLKDDLDLKGRPDSVLAREFLLTYSPEMKSKIPLNEWIAENKKWLKNRYGENSEAGRLIAFEVHLDETTPHIHATVASANYQEYYGKKCWRLNEKMIHSDNNLKKSKARFSAMQDDYASAMKQFGLERGLKGSTAKHKSIKRYYAELERDIAKFETAMTVNTMPIQKDLADLDDVGMFSWKKAIQLAKKYMKKCKKLLNESGKLYFKIDQLQGELKQHKKDSAKWRNQLKSIMESAGPDAKKVSQIKEFIVLGKPVKEAQQKAEQEAIKATYQPKEPALQQLQKKLADDKKLAQKADVYEDDSSFRR